MIPCDGIIFDLDGTLWDSADNVCDSWNAVLDRLAPQYHITIEAMQAQMGKQMHDIFLSLMPELDEQTLDTVERECCRYENEYLSVHGGILYPQLEETLSALSQRFPLFIVSNCQDGYIQAFFAAHGLGKCFRDIECSGATGLTKAENIRLICERNGVSKPVYVGDTALDGLSARQAGSAFVHAAYGFGTVSDCDAAITSIAELTGLF